MTATADNPNFSIKRRDLIEAYQRLAGPDAQYWMREQTKKTLIDWAWGADYVVIGQWNGCAMHQAGLVDKFMKRARYDEKEDHRFQSEGFSADAVVAAVLAEQTGYTEFDATSVRITD